MTYTIQTANWRDLRTLTRLERECFSDEAWPWLELLAVLTFPDVVRLKAVLNGEMVGFISADRRRKDNYGLILTLGVFTQHRRKGIARAMLRECERQLLPLPRVRLTVRRGNQPAIALYLSMGYIQKEVWPKYYASGEDALVLDKELQLKKEQ